MENIDQFRKRVNNPRLVESGTIRNNFNYLLDEIEKLEEIKMKNIEVITDYVIENQILLEQNKGLFNLNQRQAERTGTLLQAIKQTIEHLEHPNKEESIDELKDGLVGYLNGVLEGNW